MSRFVYDDEELKQIDLGEGDWIKVPQRIPYEFLEEVESLKNQGPQLLTKILPKLIRAWNLKNKDGAVAQITAENIRRLDIVTMELISEALMPLLNTDDPKA